MNDYNSTNNVSYSVKASSHIITLLGDELIGSNSLALFELVKNAYDADAEHVSIHFHDIITDFGSITIEDDGEGMSPDVIQNAWLVIGTDYKRVRVKQSSRKKRTSLGNKGVGRLAVHRLANTIVLETQAAGELFGSRLTINWSDLINSSKFVDGLTVEVTHNISGLFPMGHGTRIILSELREDYRTKARFTEMVAKLLNIKNPYNQNEDFDISITSDDSKVQEWIDSVRSPLEMLSKSLYQFKFRINKSDKTNDNAGFEWSYVFNPQNFNDSNITTAERSVADDVLPIDTKGVFEGNYRDHNLLKNDDLNGISTIDGVFYVYSFDSKIINLTFGSGSIKKVKEFVASNAGVKVFRDNIRVFNYGEPYDDWLALDQQKMQRAGDHFAKGQTVGAINLDLATTKHSLVEKTNREGFLENDTFERLKFIVQSVFGFFERQATPDREKVKLYLDKNVVQKRIGFSDTINELENKLRKKNLEGEFSNIVKKVKHDYDNMREVMLNSGMSGLNLTIIFHEVEREMNFINKSINARDCDIENLRFRIGALMDLIEKFTPLLKKNVSSTLKASTIIDRAVTIHNSRFNFHDIILSLPIKTGESPDFELSGNGGLIMSALSNLIDNSIYWVNRNREKIGDGYKCAIRVTTDTELYDGNAIIVADNGEGFLMPEDDMILPFRTLKPKGMGVGLYYVHLVMEMLGGQLVFAKASELGLPTSYSGACVVLIFPKKDSDAKR